MSRWRLIEDGEASGPWNMGVDEALLASARQGHPSIRLYRWRGPWLSLGYGQQVDPRLERACEEAGVGRVRRVTGGRAVLHGQDLTYAVASPEALLPPTLLGAYDWVARVLVDALRCLGVAATRSGPDARAPGRELFDCFAQAAPEEICVADRKLAGSAQRRVGGALLQHGSIRLSPDPDVAIEATGLAGAGATDLAELSGPVSEEVLRSALASSFEGVLGQPLERGGLSRGEQAMARERELSCGREPLWAPSAAAQTPPAASSTSIR
jgi:lipoate-protein ligase A